MKEARTITIDALRPLRRAIGAGVLHVGHYIPQPPSRDRGAVKQGRNNKTLTMSADQKKARAGLVDERRRGWDFSRCVADAERRTAQLNGNR
jgi:hypothetical protein